MSEVKELTIINKELLIELEIIKENKIVIEVENKNIKSKIDELISDNKKILEENKELKGKNKTLKEKLDKYIEKNESRNRDDWDLEI